MVDNLSIAISHVLLALMLWRLYNNPKLDHDVVGQEKRGFRKYRSEPFGQKSDSDA